jgi:hypothetical protein
VAQSGFVNDQSTATEDALRRAVDTTPAFIHTARPDGYLDYFNRGWLDFLGKPLEDVCGWRWNARRTVRSDYPDSDPQDHKSFPVVIMGTDYWHEILRFIEQMAKAGMIAPSDMQVVYVTDSVDHAIAHIRSRLRFSRFDECALTGAGWENAVYRRLSSH